MEKKKFNIINYIWIIPLLIGLAVGIIGINKIINANKMYVPPMGAEGWFDASVAQSDEKFAGIAITFSGFLFIGVFVTLICAMIPRIVRAAKEKQTAINNIQTATIDSINKSSKRSEKHCKYCGSIVKEGETKCSSCGGKDFE